MKKSLYYRLINTPYVIWATVFIVIPLGIVAYFTFTNSSGAFTFDNIAEIGDYAEEFWRSIWYALVATVITLAMSYPVAFFMTKIKANTQAILVMLVMLPMWMNLLIRTYSWTTILEKTGIINTFLGWLGLGPYNLIGTSGAVILGMVYNYLPYMILPIFTVMTKIDNSYVEAAQDLGCSTWGVIKRVVMPLSIPGVVSGITMVFVPSVSTFYIAQQLGSANTLMIGDVIQSQFDLDAYSNIGAALSFVLMILILISLAIMNRFSDEGEGEMIV